MGAKVSEVLRNKGFEVATVRPDETVADVVAMLTRNRIGAAPVLDERGRLAGIISERDVMRGIAAHGDRVLTLSARELMTREVQTCAPDDEIVELMEIMTNQRIRHLPVIQDGYFDRDRQYRRCSQAAPGRGALRTRRAASVYRVELDRWRELVTSRAP